jgi:predicted ABC-type ATPase
VPQKRLRIFAGPNGSGKSSLLNHLPKEVPLGYYINADNIESQIIKGQGIDLKNYGINCDINDLNRFLKRSEFAQAKSDNEKLAEAFIVSANILKAININLLPAYSAAIISEFIREENLKTGNDFSFETVMSHPDKIGFLKRAVKSGYNVYLYFISTDDVRVNIDRVKTRVRNGGHDVPEDKIRTRYFRSLDLLYDALKLCYKSYLFDNSDKTLEVARIDRDKMLYFSVNSDNIPNWLIKYVIAKSNSDLST